MDLYTSLIHNYTLYIQYYILCIKYWYIVYLISFLCKKCAIIGLQLELVELNKYLKLLRGSYICEEIDKKYKSYIQLATFMYWASIKAQIKWHIMCIWVNNTKFISLVANYLSFCEFVILWEY